MNKIALPLSITASVVIFGATSAFAQADVAYKNALSVWKSGKQSKAEELLKSAAAKYPTNDKIALFRATCARSRFNVEKAAPLFAEMLERAYAQKKTATNFSLQQQCALAMLTIDARRHPDAGFRVLSNLSTQNPTDPMPVWLLAIACRTYDRNEQGVAAYRKLLKIASPGSSLVHQTLANLLDELGKHDEALKSRYMAVKLEPASWSLDGLANTLSDLGRKDEAVKYYLMAIKAEPENRRSWYNLGTLLYEMKHYAESEKFLRQAVEMNPSDTSMLFNLALAVKAQKKPAQAAEMFSQYMQENPNDKRGWEYWGDCLYEQNDYAGALEKYQMIEKLGDRNPALYYALYDVLHKLGREDEAQSYKQKWEVMKKQTR